MNYHISTSVDSYHSILALGVLAIPLFLLWIAFPLCMMVHCWLNSALDTTKKILWTVAIIFTWWFYMAGAFAYGLLNFRTMAGKVFAIIVAVFIIGYPMMLPKNLDQTSTRLSLETAKLELSNLPASPRKDELLDNINTLDQEIVKGSVSKEQEAAYKQLGIYLQLLAKNGVNDEKFKEWQSVFYYRSQLPPDYVEKLIQSKKYLMQHQSQP